MRARLLRRKSRTVASSRRWKQSTGEVERGRAAAAAAGEEGRVRLGWN